MIKAFILYAQVTTFQWGIYIPTIFLCSISFAVRQHGDISLHLSCWKEKPCPLTSFFYIVSILPGLTHRGEHLWISHTVLWWCKFKRAAGTWRSQVAFDLLRRSMIADYHISGATLPSCWYSSVESSADELFWLLTHHRGRPVTVLWKLSLWQIIYVLKTHHTSHRYSSTVFME